MTNFTITGFSDEINEKIDAQFAHLKSLGVKLFESKETADKIKLPDGATP